MKSSRCHVNYQRLTLDFLKLSVATICYNQYSTKVLRVDWGHSSNTNDKNLTNDPVSMTASKLIQTCCQISDECRQRIFTSKHTMLEF